MANPFFSNNAASEGIAGRFQNFLTQFNQFRNGIQGDPKKQVEELLRSGKMSQEQFNDLYSKATEIYNSGIFQNKGNVGNPLSGFFGRNM